MSSAGVQTKDSSAVRDGDRSDGGVIAVTRMAIEKAPRPMFFKYVQTFPLGSCGSASGHSGSEDELSLAEMPSKSRISWVRLWTCRPPYVPDDLDQA